MTLTPYHKDVFSAQICPYCKSETRVTTEQEIYGRSFKNRKIICCKNFPVCDSYVGCDSEDITLGRLANKTLRQYRKQAHAIFDKIWMEKHCDRSEAYEHLSNALELPIEQTHMGWFNPETCKKVIDWASVVYRDLSIESKKTEELFEFVRKQKIKENDYNKINTK